jgi:hypothetical protein
MIDKILLFIFITSCYGLFRIESGAFAPSIDVFGYPNGALTAYIFFWLLFFWFFYLFRYCKWSLPLGTSNRKFNYQRYSRQYLFVNGFFLLVILFGFGGYHVLLGDMGKGEFRSSGLGPLGALAYGISKFAAPAVAVFLTYLYHKQERKTRTDKFYLLLNYATVFLLGACWGGKSFSMFLLLPALTVIYWRVPVGKFLLMMLVALGVMVGFALMFDTLYATDSGAALDFVLDRLTVMQAEVPWEIWELHKNGNLDVDYLRTLAPFLGDSFLHHVANISPSNPLEYISYHYGQILTYTVYPHAEIILEGHNVTGTLFSEAVIAAGGFGLVLFPLLAGLIVGVMHSSIRRCMDRGNPIGLALLLVSYYSIIFPWISSGGFITLIHISNLANLALTYAVLKLPLINFKFTARRQEPAGVPHQ